MFLAFAGPKADTKDFSIGLSEQGHMYYRGLRAPTSL